VRSFATVSGRIAIQKQLDRDKKLLQDDPSGYRLWKTAMGPYWVPKRNGDSLTEDLSEQATQVYGDREDGVHPGDVVFDCGASIGVYTRVALAAGAKLVVAIEPAPENVECLRRNFAAEIGQGRVIVVPKGVWDREDVLTLREDAGNSARDSFAGSYGPALRETRVPLTTIDRLVEEPHLDSVGFMKLDIECAEKRALAGARNTLLKYHPEWRLPWSICRTTRWRFRGSSSPRLPATAWSVAIASTRDPACAPTCFSSASSTPAPPDGTGFR